jgi:type IV pilus assembly protein PilM
LEIKEMRETSLPSGLIVNGEIQQPELVRKKLLYILGKEKNNKFCAIKTPWVVASLPEPKTFLKLITMDSDKEDATEIDVIHQAKKHLPFDVEEAYVDWQIIRPDDNSSNSQLLIGAVPKIVADSYTYLLESVGLHPLILEIEAIALARAMITADKDYTGQARAILDLSATRSSLMIFDNHSIQFSTSLQFSGEIITTAIEQGLKIEHGLAEELKIKNGLKYDSKHPKYLKIISELNKQLFDEIKNALSFYKEHFKTESELDHITMCGGVANWVGLDNFLSRHLKISTHPGRPWKNLNNPKLENFQKIQALTFSAAIGLALRAYHNPF